MDRNSKFSAGLFLLEVQCAVTFVLRPHADDVAAALAGIDQQRQCQPCTRTEGMVPLELGDFSVRPAMVAGTLDANSLHVTCGVVPALIDIHRVPQHGPQHPAQGVGNIGLVGITSHQPNDVLAPQ